MKFAGLSTTTAIAVCCILAAAAHGWAQQTPNSAGELSALRGSWQQRVLGSFSTAGNATTQGRVWTATSNVSGTGRPAAQAESDAERGLVQTQFVTGEIPFEPDAIQAASGDVVFPDPGCDVGLACSECVDVCDECCTGCGEYGCGCGNRHLSFEVGVQAFKGPADQGVNGNFGFHEGANWSAPLNACDAIGYQVGVRTLQSDIEGNQVDGAQSSGRDQTFLTAGLFRRPPCGGLQWGIVYDYFRDHYYYGSATLGQVRGELSWSHCNLWDVGFWGAFGVTDDDADTGQATLRLEPTDLYSFFYRQKFACGGNGQIWAGFTGQGDGLIGADLIFPLGRSWALENNFSYLVPNRDNGMGPQEEEAWGLAISLVWFPGRNAGCELQNPYHALFRVADNSAFMVDLR